MQGRTFPRIGVLVARLAQGPPGHHPPLHGRLRVCARAQVWVAPVHAVVPEWGLHIWWNALFMEKAPGISLNQLSYITKKIFVTNTIKDLLQASGRSALPPPVGGGCGWGWRTAVLQLEGLGGGGGLPVCQVEGLDGEKEHSNGGCGGYAGGKG